LLSLKFDVNVPTVSNMQKNGERFWLLASEMPLKKRAGSGSVIQWYRSADPDPDPYENVTDPEHCSKNAWTNLTLHATQNES
jgi:hypothetical protein